MSDLFVKALSFITFVDLNNPVVIFKCSKSYIKERITFYLEGKQEPEIVKKTQTLKEQLFEDVKISENPKEEFLKLMQEKEPGLLYSKSKNKKDEVKCLELTEDEEVFNKEIDEYTDTLTTWVNTFFINRFNTLEAFNKTFINSYVI